LSFKIDTTQILTFEFYTIECISRPIKVIYNLQCSGTYLYCKCLTVCMIMRHPAPPASISGNEFSSYIEINMFTLSASQRIKTNLLI